MSLRPSLSFVGVAVVVVGVARPAPIGVLVIGLGLALLGLDGIVTGVATKGYGPVGRRTFYGRGARLRGVMTLLLGGIIAAGGLLAWLVPGRAGPLFDTTAGRGLFLLGIGIFGALFADLLLVNEAPAVRSRALAFLLALPGRALGAPLLLLSAALIVAGTVAVAAPGAAESLVGRLLLSLGRSR